MKAIKKKHYIIPIIICVLALAGLVFFYLTGTAQLQVAVKAFRLQQKHPDRQIRHPAGRRHHRRAAETEERSSGASTADHSREQDYRQTGWRALPKADDGQSGTLGIVEGLRLMRQDGLRHGHHRLPVCAKHLRGVLEHIYRELPDPHEERARQVLGQQSSD